MGTSPTQIRRKADDRDETQGVQIEAINEKTEGGGHLSAWFKIMWVGTKCWASGFVAKTKPAGCIPRTLKESRVFNSPKWALPYRHLLWPIPVRYPFNRLVATATCGELSRGALVVVDWTVRGAVVSSCIIGIPRGSTGLQGALANVLILGQSTPA